MSTCWGSRHPKTRSKGLWLQAVPWSLRLSAIFPALQTHSLHTLLETDAAGRDKKDAHLFSGWCNPRDMNEAGKRGVHRTVKGRCIYYLMTRTCPSSPRCLDGPAQGLAHNTTLKVY